MQKPNPAGARSPGCFKLTFCYISQIVVQTRKCLTPASMISCCARKCIGRPTSLGIMPQIWPLADIVVSKYSSIYVRIRTAGGKEGGREFQALEAATLKLTCEG